MNYYKKKLFATRCRTLLIGLSILLTGCQSIPKSPHLTGLVIEQEPLTDAQVQLIDANGKQLQTTTDASGRYEFPLAGITAPLLLSAVSEGNAEDCTKNSILRPICMAAVIEKINPNQHQSTDRSYRLRSGGSAGLYWSAAMGKQQKNRRVQPHPIACSTK
jgi:hypothetical protein